MINSNTLLSVLKKRYETARLSNLYILQYDSQKTDPDLWIKNFMKEITPVTQDHPDVLIIKRGEEEKDYKVEGPLWQFFQSFIQYRPYSLKNKFVFVLDAHRISDTLSNKLLKTFEDSPDALTIFLFLKDQKAMLPTIHSRAILLSIHSNEERTELTAFPSLLNPTKIVEQIKATDDGESFFITSVIEKVLSDSPDFKKVDELLGAIKAHEQYAEFNNSQSSRVALILP